MKRPVLILGARSAIGIAIARRFAELGHPIQLAARFAHSLGAEAEYLRNRYGVAVNCVEFDVLEYGDGILSRLPTMPQIVICVVGRLHPPDLGGSNAAAVALTVRTNFEGPDRKSVV